MPIINKTDPISGRKWYEARLKVQGRPLSKCFSNYQLASDWINEQRFYRDQKINQYHQKVTIQMLFDSYMGLAKQKNRAHGTLAKAETNFKLYLKPFYGERDVRSFPVEAHEALLGTLKDYGRKAATVNRVHALLSVMFNVAMRKRHYNGSIKENPFLFIEQIPEAPEREPAKWWNANEIQTFLDYTVGSHYYPLWMMLLNAGPRIGEAAALDISQIDTEYHAITIDRTWCKSLKAIQHKPKNGLHFAPVTNSLRQVLYPYISGRKGLVFLTEKGNPINQEYLSRTILPNICKRAGVKNIGLHGMRHTFATHFYLNGGSIEDLSRILGHSSPQVTKGIYVHFTKLNVQRYSGVFSMHGASVAPQNKKDELLFGEKMKNGEIVSIKENVFHVNFVARVG